MLNASLRFAALMAGSLTLAAAAPAPVSQSEVLAMLARIPDAQGHPAGFDRAGDAREIATAISQVAPDRESAALMAVYAARESGLQKCAVGDGGRSLGAWQLQRVGRSVACSPVAAARAWLDLATRSKALCSANAPDEQLASLASGSCSNRAGRRISRVRAGLARSIAGRPYPTGVNDV